MEASIERTLMTQSEFLDIVLPFKDKLYRLAKRLLISSEEAEDATQEVLDELDHVYLNELSPFNEVNPSSENIAKYIADALQDKIKAPDVSIASVTAWESDDACATYFPE